jgi:hypothetical protein
VAAGQSLLTGYSDPDTIRAYSGLTRLRPAQHQQAGRMAKAFDVIIERDEEG